MKTAESAGLQAEESPRLSVHSLTNVQASVLEAYFSLYQERDPHTIGSGEILQWYRSRGLNTPAESEVRTVLGALKLPRRGPGRPHLEPEDPLDPLLPPVNELPPSLRSRRPR